MSAPTDRLLRAFPQYSSSQLSNAYVPGEDSVAERLFERNSGRPTSGSSPAICERTPIMGEPRNVHAADCAVWTGDGPCTCGAE